MFDLGSNQGPYISLVDGCTFPSFSSTFWQFFCWGNLVICQCHGFFFFQSLFCWFDLQPFNIFFYCSLPPPFFFICIAKTFQKSFFKLPVTMWFSTAGENYTVESFYVHDHKDQMSILHCLIVLVYFFSRPTFHDVLHFFTPFIHLNFSKKQIFIL